MSMDNDLPDMAWSKLKSGLEPKELGCGVDIGPEGSSEEAPRRRFESRSGPFRTIWLRNADSDIGVCWANGFVPVWEPSCSGPKGKSVCHVAVSMSIV